jgi:hypothetical protein
MSKRADREWRGYVEGLRKGNGDEVEMKEGKGKGKV